MNCKVKRPSRNFVKSKNKKKTNTKKKQTNNNKNKEDFKKYEKSKSTCKGCTCGPPKRNKRKSMSSSERFENLINMGVKYLSDHAGSNRRCKYSSSSSSSSDYTSDSCSDTSSPFTSSSDSDSFSSSTDSSFTSSSSSDTCCK